MATDPEKNITLTLPFGMIDKLKAVKPVLSMFGDDDKVKEAIEIIDAMYTGAMEFIRQEEGDIIDYLTSGDRDEDLFGQIDDEGEDFGNEEPN